MSMNLSFVVKDTGYFIEFPYQTTTKISYEVIELDSVQDRMKVITMDLNPEFNEYFETLKDIRNMMENEKLELIVC